MYWISTLDDISLCSFASLTRLRLRLIGSSHAVCRGREYSLEQGYTLAILELIGRALIPLALDIRRKQSLLCIRASPSYLQGHGPSSVYFGSTL